MIIAYCPSSSGLERIEVPEGKAPPSTSVWIDLFRPTPEEHKLAETLMGAEIPAKKELGSIEASARLYDEPGALVMMILMPMAARIPDPELSSLTLVLSSKRIVTVRHAELQSIALCSKKVQTDRSIANTGPAVLSALMEIVIDRCADVMEEISIHFDHMSKTVFEEGISASKTEVYHEAIRTQGGIGLQVARMHDVCTSLSRMLIYLDSHASKVSLTDQQSKTFDMYSRDVHSIKEHGDALDNKLSFLLDATIGLVNLEQNQTIKIFSVLGVVFLPPTLIASVYGMNFSNMPELSWQYGFIFSLALMLGSVALTYIYLKLNKLL